MIRINGMDVPGMGARFSGAVLTLTGRNLGVTLTKLAKMLEDEPVIEVIEDGSVTAIYRALQLRALTMEMVAGMLVTSASMTAKPVQAQQDEEIRALARQANDAAQAALAAIKAMEEGMNHA